MKAVVFDIDGTLSPEVSWLALTRDLGAPAEEHAQIYADYKAGRISYPESRRRLLGLWRATGRANRREFERLFESWPLHPAATRVVARAQARYATCLTTGSIDLYAQTVARRFGIDQWYANTTLHWDAQGEIAGYDYELRQGEKKVTHLEEFCRVVGISPSDCLVVGDGENDLELFKLTGRGVMVNSDHATPKLRAQAWKVVDDLAELEQVLESA